MSICECLMWHQLLWKESVDEMIRDNFRARRQPKFHDLMYFAAKEHPIIDVVHVRRRRRQQNVSLTNVNNLLTASPFTFSHQFLLFPYTIPIVRRKNRQTYATPINFCFVFCKTYASLNKAASALTYQQVVWQCSVVC